MKNKELLSILKEVEYGFVKRDKAADDIMKLFNFVEKETVKCTCGNNTFGHHKLCIKCLENLTGF